MLDKGKELDVQGQQDIIEVIYKAVAGYSIEVTDFKINIIEPMGKI